MPCDERNFEAQTVKVDKKPLVKIIQIPPILRMIDPRQPPDMIHHLLLAAPFVHEKLQHVLPRTQILEGPVQRRLLMRPQPRCQIRSVKKMRDAIADPKPQIASG